MNIFIEGVDRVGKDTLVKNLVEYKIKYDFHILKYSASKLKTDISNYKQQYTEMFDILDNNKDKHFILNRSHLGEPVYGQLYRKYNGHYVFDLEEEYRSVCLNSFLILLLDEPVNVIKRDDGNSFTTDLFHKSQEVEYFEYAFDKSIIPHKCKIYVNSLGVDSVYAKAADFLSVAGLV